MNQLYHGYNWYIEAPTPMEITIDIDNPVPQFEQLIEQIKAAVTAGVLKPGDSLPSIRQLANDLELNSKTVAKAYQLLTRDSIIETKGYRGTYVHPKAKANCKFNLQEWTLRKLGETDRRVARGRCDRFGNPQCVRRRHQPAIAGKVRSS